MAEKTTRDYILGLLDAGAFTRDGTGSPVPKGQPYQFRIINRFDFPEWMPDTEEWILVTGPSL